MTRVTPINETARTFQALRPYIRSALQYAARSTLRKPEAWKIREWTKEISWNLKFDLDAKEIEAELVPEHLSDVTCGIELTSLACRVAAYSETMRFFSDITSFFPKLPKPKNLEQFYRLAQKVCDAFYAVIANSRSGPLSIEISTEAQETIIGAFNELRQPSL
ncbi:MAG: hypothetical protein ABIA67_00930 [Candidatus Margulisiibacteriota bacterium]